MGFMEKRTYRIEKSYLNKIILIFLTIIIYFFYLLRDKIFYAFL